MKFFMPILQKNTTDPVVLSVFFFLSHSFYSCFHIQNLQVVTEALIVIYCIWQRMGDYKLSSAVTQWKSLKTEFLQPKIKDCVQT